MVNNNRVSRALVTGGAGFVGSHIVEELLTRRIETYVVDDLSTGSLYNLARHRNNKLLHVRVGSIKQIAKLVEDVRSSIDVVFHNAAIASVAKSVQDPTVVNDVNVNMTLELMNYCVKKGVKRFIFASSAAVYGLLGNSPASEGQLCKPLSPYGASKLAIESYIHAYGKTYGLGTVVLRYFNIYGPRQKNNDDYAGVITIFIHKLLRGEKPVIYGDGQQVRDFVNVRDIAMANILSMKSKNAEGEIFNVASGIPLTILQILETTKMLLGQHKIRHSHAPPREGDMRYALASIEKIRDKLGFVPKVSLHDGLKEVIEFAANKGTKRSVVGDVIVEKLRDSAAV